MLLLFTIYLLELQHIQENRVACFTHNVHFHIWKGNDNIVMVTFAEICFPSFTPRDHYLIHLNQYPLLL